MKILLFLFMLTTSAFAQQTVITKPYITPQSSNTSNSITATNSFQTAIAANASRASCTLQNKGNNDMWVFFGPATSANKARSIKLSSGKGINCIAGSVVLRDEVAVTGTAGDEFFAASQ